MKKNKKIYAICNKCSNQLYPPHITSSDRLNGITVSEGKCDICGAKKYCVPIRDFWFAITGDFNYWD